MYISKHLSTQKGSTVQLKMSTARLAWAFHTYNAKSCLEMYTYTYTYVHLYVHIKIYIHTWTRKGRVSTVQRRMLTAARACTIQNYTWYIPNQEWYSQYQIIHNIYWCISKWFYINVYMYTYIYLQKVSVLLLRMLIFPSASVLRVLISISYMI